VVSNNIICLVGHECGSYPGHGGIATYMAMTARALAAHGLLVHVIYLYGPGVEAPGVTNWKIRDTHNLQENSIAIARTLEKIRPHIVECSEFLGLGSHILKQRVLRGLNWRCTFITLHHTGIRDIFEWGTQSRFIDCAPSWMWLAHQMERTQTLLSDANFSPSVFLAAYLQHQYGGRFRICPSWYSPDMNSSPLAVENDKKNRGEASLKILSVGRFEGRKRQDLLIRAACELMNEGYDINVTLVGNSDRHFITRQDFREQCYRLIPPKWRARFHFYDFIPHSELLDNYKDYDLFVIPSPYENFPYSALEAINAGIMVVGSKTSGIRDMSGRELRDFCFAPDNVADIQRVIRRYYHLSHAEREVVRQSQRAALQALTGFRRSIQERINAWQRVSSRHESHRREYSPALIVYINLAGEPINLQYGGTLYSAKDNSWQASISNITHVVLSISNKKNIISVGYFPSSGVAACFSCREHHMATSQALYDGKKTFSQLVLSTDGLAPEINENVTSYLGKLIANCRIVIFFNSEHRQRESILGNKIRDSIKR